MSSGSLSQREDILLEVLGVALALMLLVGSFYLTGAPYLALGLAIGGLVVVWASMKPKRFVYVLIIWCCLYPYLESDLGMPRLLSYGGDLINILALLFSLRSKKPRAVRWGWVPVPIALFGLVALLSAIVHGVSPMLMLWEVRNVFRFFAFFLACICLLDTEDLKKIVKLLLAVFVVNLVLCSFESLVLHYGQDNTNGLFGSGSGGNAATDVLLLTMSCLAVFGYGRKAMGLPLVVFIIAGSCWISIIAELKFYFIQLVLLIAVYLVVSKPSFKNLFLAVLLLVGLYEAVQLFYLFMPSWKEFFDLQTILESSSEGGYGSNEGLNRLSAIGILQGMFISNATDNLFGLGLGAGTYSQFFSAPLYTAWGETLHWTWFTDAQIYLETGYVGLACYTAFFIVLGAHAFRLREGLEASEAALVETGGAMAFFCVLLIVYNCVLTVDPGGYLIFFFLAMPLVVDRERRLQPREGRVIQ